MTKKLHILFLSSWYPSRVAPNNGNFVQRHAEAIGTKHNVTLIHIITDINIKSVEKLSFTKNNINTTIVFIPKTNNPLIKLWLYFYNYLKEIKRINKFDIVHLNITYPVGIIALCIKWFKKTPYIITEHWTDYQPPLNKNISFFTKMITKLICRNASIISPVSIHLANAMQKFGLKGNYHPIPNVVDTNLFKPKTTSKTQFNILHVSNMNNSHKNIKGILNSIKNIQNEIEDFHFYLIGKNSIKYKIYSSKIGLKNNNISYIDSVNHTDLLEYFNLCNLFVLFSNYENLPCVILESFATGTPVISSNVGGISEYFPINFGKLIEPNNEKKLSKTILNFYYNKKPVASPTEMHKYAVEKFGIEAISTEFDKLYNKIKK
ncbi:glycosyltransferase [Lutibacter sp.]|uniref:glycosyltransferase n=1 Tax=Lutibacter sp. TaxID=1925666 RepID=UPI003569473E